MMVKCSINAMLHSKKSNTARVLRTEISKRDALPLNDPLNYSIIKSCSKGCFIFPVKAAVCHCQLTMLYLTSSVLVIDDED